MEHYRIVRDRPSTGTQLWRPWSVPTIVVSQSGPFMIMPVGHDVVSIHGRKADHGEFSVDVWRPALRLLRCDWSPGSSWQWRFYKVRSVTAPCVWRLSGYWFHWWIITKNLSFDGGSWGKVPGRVIHANESSSGHKVVRRHIGVACGVVRAVNLPVAVIFSVLGVRVNILLFVGRLKKKCPVTCVLTLLWGGAARRALFSVPSISL